VRPAARSFRRPSRGGRAARARRNVHVLTAQRSACSAFPPQPAPARYHQLPPALSKKSVIMPWIVQSHPWTALIVAVFVLVLILKLVA
jgi:hypothetical protein